MKTKKKINVFLKEFSWVILAYVFLGLVFFFFIIGDKKSAEFLIQIVFMSILGWGIGMTIIFFYAFVCEILKTEISEIIHWVIIIGSIIFINLYPYL